MNEQNFPWTHRLHNSRKCIVTSNTHKEAFDDGTQQVEEGKPPTHNILLTKVLLLRSRNLKGRRANRGGYRGIDDKAKATLNNQEAPWGREVQKPPVRSSNIKGTDRRSNVHQGDGVPDASEAMHLGILVQIQIW